MMEFVNEESATPPSGWPRPGASSPRGRRRSGDRTRPARAARTDPGSAPSGGCGTATSPRWRPPGTISIFAGCSGGIEPLFAVAFMRNQAGAMMPDVNEDFVRIAKEQGWYSEELMERIATEGHIHFDEVPQEVQRSS
jgi:hypothetical protein